MLAGLVAYLGISITYALPLVVVIAGVAVILVGILRTKPSPLAIGVFVVGAVVLGAAISGTFLFSFLDFGPRTTETETETFTPAAWSIALDVETFNGAVTVRGADTDLITVDVTKTGTESQLDDIDMEYQDSVTGGVHSVSVKATHAGLFNKPDVQIDVTVPADREYELHLDTSNGRIELSNLSGQTAEARTSNGAIELENVTFLTLEIRTSNGRIEGDFGADDARLRTSNARIRLTLTSAGDYEITTSNGAMNIEIGPDVPVRIDASTSNGDVDWSDGPLVTDDSGDNFLRGHTEDFTGTGDYVDLYLRTSNGNIDIEA